MWKTQYEVIKVTTAHVITDDTDNTNKQTDGYPQKNK